MSLRGILSKVAWHLVRYRQTREVVMCKDLMRLDPLPLSDGMTLREAREGDTELIHAFHERHRVDLPQRERIAWYISHGHKGVLAFVDGALVGYAWWSDGSLADADKHPHLGVYGITLGARDVYMTDAYVEPGKRGSGRALSLMRGAQLSLRDLGYERAFGIVAEKKVAAKWTYTVLGWQELRRQRGHVFFESIAYSNGRVFSLREQMF